MLRRCPAHGAFDEAVCPTCGDRGDEVLDEDHRTRLSKFCSGALRHFPDDVGLELDPAGWTPLADLIAAARDKYPWATAEHVRCLIAADPKGRFETDDEGRVRATYGHSVDVAIDKDEGEVPDELFHGTTRGKLDAIGKQGLRSQGRREVHLSPDVAQAREVGARHGEDVVVLRVDATGLRQEGIEIQRRSPAVFTCERVPAEHLAVAERGHGAT